MSIPDNKVFEDQIERMKQKNQKILEKFQASEEDRKNAENTGSVITKKQNVQIRLRNDDPTKQKKKNNPPPPRPKSFHDGFSNADRGQVTYNQSNGTNKHGKFHKSSKTIDDEIAYQDYFYFQQTHRSKADLSFHNNRSVYRQSNSLSYADDNYNYKPTYKDFQRSMSQKNKASPSANQNNFQTTIKTAKITKTNAATNNKLDNTKPTVNEAVSKSKNSKNKTKNKTSTDNNQNIDPFADSDDILEDLEKYRLKVDMEDFTVIDPESTNPILTKPLTSWTNEANLPVSDVCKETKHKESDSINQVKKAEVTDNDGTKSDITIANEDMPPITAAVDFKESENDGVTPV